VNETFGKANKMRGLLVTGTDTGVGKTILSASLLAAISATGEPVRAHKPVVTGLGEPSGDWPHDHELLALAAGMHPDAVTPLRFDPAVSPHLAAELAGQHIDPAKLLASARDAARDAPPSAADGQSEQATRLAPQSTAAGPGAGATLIVEGVGGLLVPLTEKFSVCNFAAALNLGVLIAARPGLGTINHTLLTLQTARAADLDVRAVVLTPWPDLPSTMERSNRESIERIGEIEVATLPLVSGPDQAELAKAGDTLPWRRWLEPA
jgi:dethiobiotin synthetase